jgi:hypothetical protein
MATLPGRLDVRLREGLDATCESIAARARQTDKYTDRTGLLRASTQNAGVTGGLGGQLTGIVSFAARSKRGFLYGLVVEDRKHFIQEAIDAQSGKLLEGSMNAAFRDAGFKVTG